MPVFPCFDPTTGASGGPSDGGGGGGGGDIDSGNVEYETIDLTDGSWELVDPDDIIASVSIASGVHTFTLSPQVGGTLQDYVPTAGTPRWPRWVRRFSPNGIDCNTDDHTILLTRMSDLSRNFTDPTYNNWGIYMLHGVYENASETVANLAAMHQSTFFVQWNSGSSATPLGGAICNGQRSAFTTGANQDRWFGHVITRPDLHIGVTGWALKSTGVVLGNNFRQYTSSNPFTTPAVPLFEVVGFAFSNGTSDSVAAGDSFTMKIMGRRLKLNIAGA